jgi:hypothetical protein
MRVHMHMHMHPPQALFTSMDKDLDGTIGPEDLAKALQQVRVCVRVCVVLVCLCARVGRLRVCAESLR